jgi:hypothetical protein
MIKVSNAMLRVAYEAVGQATPDLTTPAERIRLLGALVPQLLALDGGAQRMAEWAPRVGPDEPPVELKRRLRQTLAVYGDGHMADVVISTLATTVPPAVREFVLAELALVLVGWDSGAWTTRLGLRGSQLVVISGTGLDADALALLLCHEVVHGWHAKPSVLADLPTLTAPHEQLVLAVAQEGAGPRSPSALCARASRTRPRSRGSVRPSAPRRRRGEEKGPGRPSFP